MSTQWTADAYEGFTLSDAKKDDCKRISMAFVHEALQLYQKFDRTVPRKVDSKHWKAIKSSDNVTLYQERNPSRRAVKDPSTDSAGWQMPRAIIGNGTISHNIDDLLYGLAYGDEAAFLQGASYAGLPLVNGQILSTIEKPTLEHPYRSTTLQWHANTPNPALRGIVTYQDAVYIRATGMLQVDKSERIGYCVMHSVDLSSTSPLDERGNVRSRVSSCMLFKPISNESVEVFVKGYYEVFRNEFLDSISGVSLASALMNTWTSSQCAKLKKVSWLLQRKDVDKNDVMGLIGSSDSGNKKECQSCKSPLGVARRAHPCILCESSLCEKCILPIELFDVVSHLKLTTKKANLCIICDKKVSQVNSYDVARQQIRAGRYEEGGIGSTLVELFKISQLTEGSSDLSGKKSCAGEVYEFNSKKLGATSEDSLSAYAQLTSYNDDTHIVDSETTFSDEGSATRGSGKDGDELEALIENAWRKSISKLNLEDQERDRQLAWLEMTKLRLQQDSVSTTGSNKEGKDVLEL